MHAADSHDIIKVVGARENNLREVTVEIPKRRLTVFTGVSGSGKSSLVFDTVAAESQRMINETYPAFVQGFMPDLDRPDVDRLEGLTTAIVVGQDRLGANQRSTVGTATDANALLRKMFSEIAEPHIGSPNAYSFNVPSVQGSGTIKVSKGQGKAQREHKTYHVLGGMCPRCEGLGHVSDLDLTELFDDTKSLNEGPFTIPGYTPDGWNVRLFIQTGFFDPDKPIRDYSERELDNFLYRENAKVKVGGANLTFNGIVPSVRKSFLTKDRDAMQPHIRAFVDRAVTFQPCPECGGTRLAPEARSSKVRGLHIGEVCDLQITDALAWARTVDDARVAPLTASLVELLEAFVELGLGYLSLSRPSGTLSGGEAQRIKMIRHLGSALTDVTYIFDEPTAGLHPADVERMSTLLQRLRDKGNTVLVVEHKPEVMAIADHIVDLGPRAGSHGGEVVFEGTVEGLRTANTLTGQHFAHRVQLKEQVRTPSGAIQVRGASRNNLRDLDVDIPLGCLTVLTGVAGSGKSSLIQSIPKDLGAILVDQSPIKGSRRSNPATYTSLLEPVRKAFAKANGVKPSLFSANSDGACPACKGNGVIITELGFMSTVTTPCLDCGGRRFQDEVLAHTLGGKSIADVYEMGVAEALEFFADGEARVPAATKILTALHDVGLGYLTLGQGLDSLSGGERQRLKLATHMSSKGGIYVLDEPTTGLHMADVDQLLALLDQLVESGKSVIVVEHHQAVIAHADWVIDMGPGAGHDGGLAVFEGAPAGLAEADTVTGRHLARYLAS
ncbi:MAG: excinuclease ABC subunit UvrA [Propionibacteriaceae bacterium]|nr:excinuclease ABC subunit UvrA [Propionibacteriaceae bacterium]